MMMMMMMRLQTEAAALRNVMSGGVPTKLIALGIGRFANVTELRGMASPPQDRNVILVPAFSALTTFEMQLMGEICPGK